MPAIDIFQNKRKLKHPHVRIWINATRAEGDDYHYVMPSIKQAKLVIARAKKKHPGRARRIQGIFVAHDGKEYTLRQWEKRKGK